MSKVRELRESKYSQSLVPVNLERIKAAARSNTPDTAVGFRVKGLDAETTRLLSGRGSKNDMYNMKRDCL